jgi:hypothetical protein
VRETLVESYQRAHAQTCETTPAILWYDAVRCEVIRIVGETIAGVGNTAEWTRLDAQRVVIRRAYANEEPAWMAIDELVVRAEGAAFAEREVRT